MRSVLAEYHEAPTAPFAGRFDLVLEAPAPSSDRLYAKAFPLLARDHWPTVFTLCRAVSVARRGVLPSTDVVLMVASRIEELRGLSRGERPPLLAVGMEPLPDRRVHARAVSRAHGTDHPDAEPSPSPGRCRVNGSTRTEAGKSYRASRHGFPGRPRSGRYRPKTTPPALRATTWADSSDPCPSTAQRPGCRRSSSISTPSRTTCPT